MAARRFGPLGATVLSLLGRTPRPVEERGRSRGLSAERPEKGAFLRAIDIFRDLEPSEMAWLEQITTMVTCPRGRLIYSQEEVGEVLFLLKKGKVAIYRLTADGKKLTIATIEPGTFFGEMSLIGQRMYDGFAEAVEDSLVCAMTRADLERIVLTKPKVALRMIEVIGQRLFQSEERLEHLAFRSVPSRLAALLLRLAEERGREVEGYSHNDFAELVGTYRETVTKTLDEFKELGLVELGRRRLTVLDEAGLRAIAEA